MMHFNRSCVFLLEELQESRTCTSKCCDTSELCKATSVHIYCFHEGDKHRASGWGPCRRGTTYLRHVRGPPVQARCHRDQSVRLASFLQRCDESTATRGRPRVTPSNECFIVLPKSQPKSMSKPGLGAESETVGAGFATMFYGRCTKVHRLL